MSFIHIDFWCHLCTICILWVLGINQWVHTRYVLEQTFLKLCLKIVVNPCHAALIKMPCPFLTGSQSGCLIQVVDTFLIGSQSDCLIQFVDTNSHTEWQAVQIQISWLLQKPTDLDLHCLQRQGISGFSRTRLRSACTSSLSRLFPFLYHNIFTSWTAKTLIS